MTAADLTIPPQCPRCRSFTKPVRVEGRWLCNSCGDHLGRPEEAPESQSTPLPRSTSTVGWTGWPVQPSYRVTNARTGASLSNLLINFDRFIPLHSNDPTRRTP